MSNMERLRELADLKQELFWLEEWMEDHPEMADELEPCRIVLLEQIELLEETCR